MLAPVQFDQKGARTDSTCNKIILYGSRIATNHGELLYKYHNSFNDNNCQKSF